MNTLASQSRSDPPRRLLCGGGIAPIVTSKPSSTGRAWSPVRVRSKGNDGKVGWIGREAVLGERRSVGRTERVLAVARVSRQARLRTDHCRAGARGAAEGRAMSPSRAHAVWNRGASLRSGLSSLRQSAVLQPGPSVRRNAGDERCGQATGGSRSAHFCDRRVGTIGRCQRHRHMGPGGPGLRLVLRDSIASGFVPPPVDAGSGNYPGSALSLEMWVSGGAAGAT